VTYGIGFVFPATAAVQSERIARLTTSAVRLAANAPHRYSRETQTAIRISPTRSLRLRAPVRARDCDLNFQVSFYSKLDFDLYLQG
jgi:hypothetical protein